MTRIGIRDELLSAQTLRAMGSAPYGGADIGECLAAARRAGADPARWHDAWTAAALAAGELAEQELAAGRDDTARLAFWRASSYYRTAGCLLLAAPPDPRLIRSNVRQTEAFRRGAALLAQPPELVQIPYAGTALPGYFFRAAPGRRAAGPRSSCSAATTARPRKCTSPAARPRWPAATTCWPSTGRARAPLSCSRACPCGRTGRPSSPRSSTTC